MLAGGRRHGDRVLLPGRERRDPEPRAEEDLANANSLTVTVEHTRRDGRPARRDAARRGVGNRRSPYLVNAVTFLVSALLVARDPGDEAALGGAAHARPLARRRRWAQARRDSAPAPDGARRLERRAPRIGAVNVAEVVFAKDTLDAGDIGSARSSRASGVGLAIGSFLERAGARAGSGCARHYVSSLVLMGVGLGRCRAAAARSGSQSRSSSAAPRGTARSIVCNRLLVQRGAPDQYRGRALATIMSSNYAVARARDGSGGRAHRHGRRARGMGRRGRRLSRRRVRRARA